MDNFLSGGIPELEQAKAAIVRADKLNADMLESEKLLKANDKDVEAQRKFMTDKIESSIKERRDELVKFHDEQIQEVRKEIKNIEKERKAAKTKAVNSRISGATNQLTSDNKQINRQIRSMFRQAKIPACCNNAAYYSLFHPKTVKDFIILAICVIIAVVVIPNVVCLLIDTSTVIRVLIYAGIVLVFVALYFAIFVLTKGKGKASVIEKARVMRKRIRNNKKQIKLTSDNIRSDMDESGYDLQEFDIRLQQTNSALAARENAKTAALNEFDNVTAQSVKTEIENENIPVIQQLEADGKALKADFLQKQESAANAQSEIKNTYATYLGAKNTTPEKIDEIITIMNEGKAQTIMQALDIINGEIK